MGRPFTLLEDLCRHALSVGANSLEIESRDRCEWIYGRIGDTAVSFANFPSSGTNARELLENLYRAHKRAMRTVLDGQVYVLSVRVSDKFGEDAFEVKIEPVAKPDPGSVPRFTKTQGQYLAFIYHYANIHGVAPAEADLQQYFRVSPPSVHEMIKTLERNSLIERTPREARSIRLLVRPEHLPPLG